MVEKRWVRLELPSWASVVDWVRNLTRHQISSSVVCLAEKIAQYVRSLWRPFNVHWHYSLTCMSLIYIFTSETLMIAVLLSVDRFPTCFRYVLLGNIRVRHLRRYGVVVNTFWPVYTVRVIINRASKLHWCTTLMRTKVNDEYSRHLSPEFHNVWTIWEKVEFHQLLCVHEICFSQFINDLTPGNKALTHFS